MTDLVVSEIFGPTFQGEGPSAGRLAMFLRLGRCNLDCTWCDTPYTWDWTRFDPAAELHHMSVADVRASLEAIGAPMLVVSGGEPMLQQSRLVPLLADKDWRVEVETNGTLAPAADIIPLVDQWNVSPKLRNAGVSRTPDPEVLQCYVATGRAIAKFVVGSAADLEEADAIVDAAGFTDVWIMPEGTDTATLDRRATSLAPEVMARGWNLTTRLHVHLWGDSRGV